MSVEGNSRLSQVREHNAFIESQRPQSSYANSQEIEDSKNDIDNLRAQLMGGEEVAEGATAGKPGYRNGKFSMRAFLEDQKIGRAGFEAYSDSDIQKAYGAEANKGFIDLAAQDLKIEKLGKLHDERSKLEIQLESASGGSKASLQSQIDALNAEIQAILTS